MTTHPAMPALGRLGAAALVVVACISPGGQAFARGAPAPAAVPAGVPSGPRVQADFNGDGAQDLAIGVVNEITSSVTRGAVNVLLGAPGQGLAGARSQYFTQLTPGLGNVPDGDAAFGTALAVGDFDGDGFDDLAVGAPGQRVGEHHFAGAVHVIYGSAAGLNAGRASHILTHDALDGAQKAFAGAYFGRALAAGDLDGDGLDDLAIGSPETRDETPGGTGLVDVAYGSSTGLDRGRPSQQVSQGSPDVPGDPLAGDLFGYALAIGDFDLDVPEDGAEDLAVGVPGDDVSGLDSAGAVNVLLGGSGGLAAGPLIHQGTPGVVSDPEQYDAFGSALAAGQFGQGSGDDLAIGVPDESAGTVQTAGAVNVLFGGPGGLSGPGSQLFHQGAAGVISDPELGDRFGVALAAGDFDGDETDDLVAGVPGESAGTVGYAGAVNVLFGGSGGLSGPGSQLFHQGSAGVVSDPEADDAFGSAVAAGDFDADGDADLVVGVPQESVGTIPAAGAINVLPGTAGGLTGTGSTLFHQDVAGIGAAAEAEDLFGWSLAVGGS